jgi:hypothetical protein
MMKYTTTPTACELFEVCRRVLGSSWCNVGYKANCIHKGGPNTKLVKCSIMAGRILPLQSVSTKTGDRDVTHIMNLTRCRSQRQEGEGRGARGGRGGDADACRPSPQPSRVLSA